MALSTAIYTLLRANSDVLTTFADRIFPVAAPPGASLPCLTYTVTSHAQDETKNDYDAFDTINVRIGVYATTYANCETYHNYVYTALQGYTGTNSSEKILFISCENRRTDDIAYDYNPQGVVTGIFAFVIYMDFQINRG